MRIKIVLLCIGLFVVAPIIACATAVMVEKKREEISRNERIKAGIFRFEDYQNEAEIETALTALYPVASDLMPLLNMLENLGMYLGNEVRPVVNGQVRDSFYTGAYAVGPPVSPLFCSRNYQVYADYSEDKKIKKINITSLLTCA